MAPPGRLPIDRCRNPRFPRKRFASQYRFVSIRLASATSILCDPAPRVKAPNHAKERSVASFGNRISARKMALRRYSMISAIGNRATIVICCQRIARKTCRAAMSKPGAALSFHVRECAPDLIHAYCARREIAEPGPAMRGGN
jgi:hypothetical protein